MRHLPACVLGSLLALFSASQARARVACDIVEIGSEFSMTFVDDLNDAGQVVGSVLLGAVSVPFLWQDGELVLLDVPENANGEARAINESGQIVGQFMDNAIGQVVPVIWTDQGMMVLPHPHQALAVDINDQGEIVGFDQNSHCLYWADPTSPPIDIGTLGGGMCSPSAISERGEIVGQSVTATGSMHAFVWRDGVFTDLGEVLPPDPSGLPNTYDLVDINDAGEAVGVVSTATGTRPLLWTEKRGARVLAMNVSRGSINDRGTVAFARLSPGGDAELMLGRVQGGFHSKGTLPGDLSGSTIHLNDAYQVAWSSWDPGSGSSAYFCALRGH